MSLKGIFKNPLPNLFQSSIYAAVIIQCKNIEVLGTVVRHLLCHVTTAIIFFDDKCGLCSDYL